jgi:hypothetical protein
MKGETMAEADSYLFDYKEVAEALIKQLDLHEGLWGVAIQFGLAARNMPTATDGKTFAPAAIIPVEKIGLNRWTEANNLTVDAAVVNPQSTKRERRAGGRRATPTKRTKK